MNKVVNINLGGKKFTIDEQAYSYLDKYLSSINKQFSSTAGFEDIMYDIELRISELLEEDLKGSEIISYDNVKRIEQIMGTPNDFIDDNPKDSGRNSASSNSAVTRKRLYRDPDNKVIGGVSSGLSAYFGIGEPLILRVIFFVMLITGGIGIIPYIIAWIFIPEAKTALEKMEMRGEPINIESISKTVEDGFSELKVTLEDLSKNIKKNM